MPPQPVNPPRSPKPKAPSPNILAAIRNFTGQKKTLDSEIAASTPARDSPSSLDGLAEEGALAAGRQSLRRARPSALLAVPDDSNGNGVVSNGSGGERQLGGPPRLEAVVDLLSPENDVEERIRAAKSVSGILAHHSVGSISGIWQKAGDLLESGYGQEAFSAGYNLMLACISHPCLVLTEKPLFFDSISTGALLDRPALCLDALVVLTNHAKSLEGLAPGQLTSLLVTLLKASYDAVSARRKGRTDKPDPGSKEETTLADLFRYLLDVIKFNSTVFEKANLEVIIDQVLRICRRTRAKTDLEHSLELLDTIVTYAVLPRASLRASVEVLCGIFCSVDDLKRRSKFTLSNLLGSHLGSEVLNTLHDVLRENPSRPSPDRNVIRGAVQLLREVIEESLQDITPKVTLSDVLPALYDSLILDSARLELDILQTLNLVLRAPEMMEYLFRESEWTDFSRVVTQCSNGRAIAKVRSANTDMTVIGQQAKNDKDSDLIFSFSSAFSDLASQLMILSQNAEPDRKTSIMALLLQIVSGLDDDSARVVIVFYSKERLLLPSQGSWLENCRQMQRATFEDISRSSSVRLLSLEILCDAYASAEALNVSETEGLVVSLIESINTTKNLEVFERLIAFAIATAQWTADSHMFSSIVVLLHQTLSYGQWSLESNRSQNGESTQPSPTTQTTLIARGLVRLFLRCVNVSSSKSEVLFLTLLEVARSAGIPADARVISMKLLARIRSDDNHAIFIIPDTGSENLAAALCRTTESAAALDAAESAPRRSTREEEVTSRRLTQTLQPPLESSSSPGRSSRSGGGPVNTPKTSPPLWMYPGPKGLPEEPPSGSSHVTFAHTDKVVGEKKKIQHRFSIKATLKMGLWLELVLDLLQREELEWETYSYLIVHLGAQLMNHALFFGAEAQIKLLRSVLCDLLHNKTFHEPPSLSRLKKSGVAICLYQILTILVSYHHLFAKSEQEEIVRTFVGGIGSWERTSEVCIHALSVCCHELPMSIVKQLGSALQRMIQIITQSTNAVHVLEFLAGLARLPNLFRNFREEDFKDVFGICFRYLQYVREQRSRTGPSTNRTNRDSLDVRGSGNSLAEVLPQYVYALTYHVMTFWFMALRLQDRPRQMAWIRKNLIFTNEHGEQVMEEQSLVTIDLMHRVAYSDRDESAPNSSFATEADGMVSLKMYLVGLSILTIETAGRSGVSHITIRRPSGNKYSVSRPQVTELPRHQIAINPEKFHSPDYVGVSPEDVVQNLYSPLSISPWLASLTEGPIPLPDDEATRRSIASFDRISALDGHKVGIIYVGDGQTSETDILANVTGSAGYMAFLHGIGTLTELQGATFNTQGLDREYGSDGKFTFCWRDRVSELVFHVPTMMPTNLEQDPQCAYKKRHIGNDFVNIIFNNSGLPFNFDTFPSDFNYVNIVISPEARSSFTRIRSRASRGQNRNEVDKSETDVSGKDEGAAAHGESEDDMYYKVTVMTKHGLPKVSPAAETQILSGKGLPAFVRLLALNASVFAQVWANRAGGEHVSSWRSRLREIVRLRERQEIATGVQAGENHSGSQPSVPQSQGSGSERGNGPSRDSTVLRRTSAATFFSDGSTNRSSSMSAATEMERSNSAESHG